jgi:hypothetical protein
MNMKAAASLTGSLLARKGAAYPAAYSAPSTSSDSDSSDSSQARAYNDPRVIASAPPAPVAPAAMSAPAPQHGEQFQDGRPASIVKPEPVTPEPAPVSMTPPPAPAIGGVPDAAESVGLPQTMDKMGRVRLSVRLDPDRYLRVKMASARTRWSAQDIVIAALDRYLGDKGEANDDGGDQGSLN